MEIDLMKLSEIYGVNIVHDINDNLDNFIPNIKYLKKIGFEDIENIIELYPYLFISDNVEFIEKVNKLIKKVGLDYVYHLTTNMDLWGYIDE